MFRIRLMLTLHGELFSTGLKKSQWQPTDWVPFVEIRPDRKYYQLQKIPQDTCVEWIFQTHLTDLEYVSLLSPWDNSSVNLMLAINKSMRKWALSWCKLTPISNCILNAERLSLRGQKAFWQAKYCLITLSFLKAVWDYHKCVGSFKMLP